MTYVRAVLLFVALLTSLASAQFASGQDVRFQTESYSSAMRGALRESENQGTNWVDLIGGDRGTQVHILFKVDNVDLLVMVPFDVNRKALLEDSKRIANEVDLPKIDFIEAEGTKTRMVDLEANDYIRRAGDTSHFEWNFSKLVEAFEKSKVLPKPIYYYVRKSDAKFIKLNVDGKVDSRDLTTSSFFSAKEVKPASKLVYHETVTLLGKSVAWLMIGFMLVLVLAMPILMWWPAVVSLRNADEFAKQAAVGTPGEESKPPKSPEEVQAAYLESVKNRPMAILKSLPGVLPMLIVLPMVLGRGAMDRAPTPEVLNRIPTNFLLPAMVLLAGTSFVGSRIWLKLKLRRRGIDKVPKTKEQIEAEKSMWFLKLIMIPLIFMMAFLVGMPFLKPYLRGVNPTLIRVIIFAPMVITFAAMALISRKKRNETHIELSPGDQWYDVTMDYAQRANAKIRGVRIQKTEVINASASLWRIVTINEGLLEKLPEEEVKAIIAHEVGHIRFQHVPKGILLSLALQVPLFFGYYSFAEWLDRNYKISLFGLGIFANMLISFIILPVVSWQKRKAEREADRFAMETIGSRETVERALVAIHTLNEAPHELVKFDEVLSTHPSLKNRIAALRLANPD
ncbi:MAG: M48 family metalloprotease [Armatimonadota bacterium]